MALCQRCGATMIDMGANGKRRYCDGECLYAEILERHRAYKRRMRGPPKQKPRPVLPVRPVASTMYFKTGCLLIRVGGASH